MNPQAASGVSDELLAMGLPGIAILCLGVAVVYLARKYDKAKTDAVDARSAAAAHTEALQERRHVEQIDLMNRLTAVLDRNAEALTKQAATFESQAAAFDSLTEHCSLRDSKRGGLNK